MRLLEDTVQKLFFAIDITTMSLAVVKLYGVQIKSKMDQILCECILSMM